MYSYTTMIFICCILDSHTTEHDIPSHFPMQSQKNLTIVTHPGKRY